jgi:hypothetical protein
MTVTVALLKNRLAQAACSCHYCAKNDVPYWRLEEALVSAQARMAIQIEVRRNHTEALTHLAQIASEEREQSKFLVIDG